MQKVNKELTKGKLDPHKKNHEKGRDNLQKEMGTYKRLQILAKGK